MPPTMDAAPAHVMDRVRWTLRDVGKRLTDRDLSTTRWPGSEWPPIWTNQQRPILVFNRTFVPIAEGDGPEGLEEHALSRADALAFVLI